MLNAAHPNNFNLLRLLAALAVLHCHGDFLYRLSLPVPFAGHSLGAVGVSVFFFISGYLIAQSWARSQDGFDFVARRIARIFPGLLAASLFSVGVIGAWMSTWPAAVYWSDSNTWLYLINNALGLSNVQVLPGVFENNPFAHAVNGSLWTIRYELLMYGALVLIAWLGERWQIRHLYAICAASLAGLWLLMGTFQWSDPLATAPAWLSSLWELNHITTLGVFFFIGAAFAHCGIRSEHSMGALGALALLTAAWSTHPQVIQLWLWLGIPCLTFYLGHIATQMLQGRPHSDLSYGLYIYAFPIQQALAQIGLSHGWSFATYLSASLLATTALAAASWCWLEKPVMAWVRRALDQRQTTAPARTPPRTRAVAKPS